MKTGAISVRLIGFMITIAAIGLAQESRAAIYPGNTCVSGKMAAAAAYCKSVLKTWGTWDKNQNNAKRDEALGKAATKLADKWTKAETTAAKKGVNCAETTIASTALKSMVDTSVADVVNGINAGLNLGSNKDHVKCGLKLLRATGKKCAGLLKAEARYIRTLRRDPTGATRDAAKTKASQEFADAWGKATAKACPTAATEGAIEGSIDDLSDQVVVDTTVSPNVDNTQFTMITPMGSIPYLGKWLKPVCMNGSPYAYFVKRGSVNKLLIYYQGGGACWDYITCSIPMCYTNVNPAGDDNPNKQHSGFSDLSDPRNPFRDWNVVVVSYCSCDIHFGDADQDYVGGLHVEHRGYQNARVVEKWAREHFVNPERIFVTGSSAGAYGAWFNAPLHEAVWPASHFDVLADAGNGVITQDFLDNEFPHWKFAANLPRTIPGLRDTLTNGTGVPGYTKVVTSFFPDTRWAHYSTAFDGGLGGQTSFYQVMLNLQNFFVWANWWEASCAFNANMRKQAIDTAAAVPLNYRYYIGTGSLHTMWGSDKVYTDTTGGVPLIVDWVNAMLAGDPDWVNVEAGPANVLLPGDPQPSPLQAPFELSGGDTIVNCP